MPEQRRFLNMIGGGKVFLIETSGSSPPATDEYLGYIQHFYDFELTHDICMDQVHALQALRDVARAIVDRVHKDVWGRVADEIAVPLASWISEDAYLLDKVVLVRERWFERSRGGNLAASLARMEEWAELKDMAKVSRPPTRNW